MSYFKSKLNTMRSMQWTVTSVDFLRYMRYKLTSELIYYAFSNYCNIIAAFMTEHCSVYPINLLSWKYNKIYFIISVILYIHFETSKFNNFNSTGINRPNKLNMVYNQLINKLPKVYKYNNDIKFAHILGIRALL